MLIGHLGQTFFRSTEECRMNQKCGYRLISRFSERRKIAGCFRSKSREFDVDLYRSVRVADLLVGF